MLALRASVAWNRASRSRAPCAGTCATEAPRIPFLVALGDRVQAGLCQTDGTSGDSWGWLFADSSVGVAARNVGSLRAGFQNT
jgi:hypothetical protein